MKKINLIITLLLLAVITFSCEKEDVLHEETLNEETLNENISISSKSGISNAFYGSRSHALSAVRELKSLYGNGVSSLMIIHNNSSVDIRNTSTYSNSGRFYVRPTQVIPSGKWGVALGVKPPVLARGFEGRMIYSADYSQKASFPGNYRALHILESDAPFSGANKVKVNSVVRGDDARRDGASPLSDGGWQTSVSSLSNFIGGAGYSFQIIGRITKNASSPEIEFVIKDRKDD